MVRINGTYHSLYNLDVRYIVVYGGRRSSKSWGVSKLLVRKAMEHHHRRVVVLRKFGTSIRLSVWDRVQNAIMEVMPLSRCDINKGERRITLPTGSEFLFVGADDPEKLKSIENVTDYWLEEATEFTANDFDVLDAGMSTPCTPPPQIYMTFNPVPQISGYQHWLQRRFLGVEHAMSVPRVVGNACVLRTWYKDNLMCPQTTIDLLEGYKDTNPSLYLMWALGEFTKLAGAILSNVDVVAVVGPGAHFLGYSIDFGYANDPCAVVAVWQRGRDVWLQQLIYATGLTNPDLSEAMDAVGVPKSADIMADCAEPKSIEELRRAGWMVQPAIKFGKTFKRSAALYMQGLWIHVLEDSGDIQRECATWSWRTDPKSTDEEGRVRVLPLVADGNDHAIDAAIYRLYRPGGTIGLGSAADSVTGISSLSSSIIKDNIPTLGGAP